jgi:hypothetical protein
MNRTRDIAQQARDQLDRIVERQDACGCAHGIDDRHSADSSQSHDLQNIAQLVQLVCYQRLANHDVLNLDGAWIAAVGGDLHDDVAVGEHTDHPAHFIAMPVHGEQPYVLVPHQASGAHHIGSVSDGNHAATAVFAHVHDCLLGR